MKCGIYGIKNLVNGKIYVGQSVNMSERNRSHFSKLQGCRHCNEHLQSAFNMYGIDSFEFRVLEEVATDMLDVRECSWIAYYKSNQSAFGYNLQSGGHKNKRYSNIICQKISNARRGKPSNFLGCHHLQKSKHKISESKKGVLNPMYGKSVSLKIKNKISESLTGKPKPPRSQKHKDNLSKACKGHIPWNLGKHINKNNKEGGVT